MVQACCRRWCSLRRQANIISRILISVCVTVRSKEPGGDRRDAALLMTSGGSVDEPPPALPTPIRKQGHMKEKQYEGDVCLSTKTSFPTELAKITAWFFSPQRSLFFDQILLFVWQMQKKIKGKSAFLL